MVVKAVGESGGYGLLIGPQSTAARTRVFAEKIQADPRNYIAAQLCGSTRSELPSSIRVSRDTIKGLLQSGRNQQRGALGNAIKVFKNLV